MQFWCTYCGLRFRPRPLFWFWACKCCMYVHLEARLSIRLSMLPVSVPRRYVWHCANGMCNLLPHACIVLAFALGDRLVVDKPPSVDEVCPKVVIRGEEFFFPEHYPKDASGKLEYDKNLIKELEEKTTKEDSQHVQAQPSLCTTHLQRQEVGPHLQARVLRLHIKHACVHLIYVYIYLSYKSSFFS